ncbi:MAG: glycosyltransferase [Candidatus Aenigmatarchaeota archaeon]
MIYNFILPIAIIILAVAIFWLTLYIIFRKKINKKPEFKNYFPFLSVIIAAYNEEKNIKNTLNSIFKSNYPKKKMEVIVVDDGSTDKTSEIVKKFPVKLIKYKPNKGKVFALNKGLSKAKGEIIVTLDADTELESNALKLLSQHFKDERVGAVAGIYKSKNTFSWKDIPNFLLEKIQSLEYLGFALVRKQQEMLDSILVVPGAVAAYKKEVLIKVGGFDDDTLIEDYDMTLKIHKAGYKVKCDKYALGWIRAPSNLSSFIRQRTRWYRGGLQVLRKHLDMFSTKFGAVTFVWSLEILGMLLQLFVFGVVIFKIIQEFIYFSLPEILLKLKIWLMNILSLNFDYFTLVFLFTLFLTSLGIINMIISIKLTNDSKKKLLLYPLMTIYSSFLVLIFMKSIFQELFNMKRTW